MANIELRYGDTHFYFDHDPSRFEVVAPRPAPPPLTDAEIGRRFDEPIGSAPLDEIIKHGDKILIVVPDATREAACGQVVNLLVRRLIAAGVGAADLSIIFATGIHRPVSPQERSEILTPFIAQRIRTIDHAPRDITRLIRIGETEGGVPIELNRALFEHDLVILIGGVSFHYFAGFTGGRKLVCPGLASTRTIAGTHKIAFDCEKMSRRDGVGPGLLGGNPVHEAFVEAASHANPGFLFNTIVDDHGALIDLYCGDWLASHENASSKFNERNSVAVNGKRTLVIASCGGYPYDINMIQAHKTFDAATRACEEGGTVILLAECRDGLGRDDFLKWFDVENSGDLAIRLCGSYQVNGQTAWSLLTKAERFEVRIVTELAETKTAAMRMQKFGSLAAALEGLDSRSGYILPSAARLKIDA
ncbi:MAG: nickel-dependent lactate racemase [Pyrinomonadaceae bacterium]